MKYLSICSGIEAATVAWHPLGWEPVAFSEIEPFPCAVLGHHYPEVSNLGDITNFKEWPEYESVELIVGGTPCQSFSVAGLRKGLDDPRGNLALTYLAVVERYRPRWIVWENVPGLLSSNKGKDLGSFLGALGELGYGWAYRILDAQFFGVPQRRRRVFVVGYFGDWRPPAAVLFERHSLQGHSAPGRKKGERVAGATAPSLTGSGRGVERVGESRGQDPVVACLRSGGKGGIPSSRGKHIVFEPGNIRRKCGSEPNSEVVPTLGSEKTGDTFPCVATTLTSREQKVVDSDCTSTLVCHGTQDPCVQDNAFALGRNSGQENVVAQTVGALSCNTGPKGHDAGNFMSNQAVSAGYVLPVAQGVTIHGTDKTATVASMTDTAGALRARTPGGQENSSTTAVYQNMQVRRLTPVECEFLQGFPKDYTRISYRNKPADQCPDGPRYKALGNSMAVPVMRWIGERIREFLTCTT